MTTLPSAMCASMASLNVSLVYDTMLLGRARAAIADTVAAATSRAKNSCIAAGLSALFRHDVLSAAVKIVP